MTGTAQQGCQTAQAQARQTQSQVLDTGWLLLCQHSHSTFPAPPFRGIMAAKEAFFCSSTGTFLRLFSEQEFLWSKQGFLHFPAPIFMLAGAESFLWGRMPSVVPCSCSSFQQGLCLLWWMELGPWCTRRRNCPKPRPLVPALPCRRFELGTLCLESRIYQALKASPSHIPCAGMSVQGHRGGQEKQAPRRTSRQDSPSPVFCGEQRVEDASHV